MKNKSLYTIMKCSENFVQSLYNLSTKQLQAKPPAETATAISVQLYAQID